MSLFHVTDSIQCITSIDFSFFLFFGSSTIQEQEDIEEKQLLPAKRMQARQEDGAASGTAVTGLTANERVKITREGRKKEKEGNSPLLDLWMRSEIRKNEAIASYFSYKLNLARGAQPTAQQTVFENVRQTTSKSPVDLVSTSNSPDDVDDSDDDLEAVGAI